MAQRAVALLLRAGRRASTTSPAVSSSSAALAATTASFSSSSSRSYATDLAPYSALRSSLGERGGSGGRSSVSRFG